MLNTQHTPARVKWPAADAVASGRAERGRHGVYARELCRQAACAGEFRDRASRTAARSHNPWAAGQA